MTNSRNRRALKVGSGLAALAGLALIVVLIAYQQVSGSIPLSGTIYSG